MPELTPSIVIPGRDGKNTIAGMAAVAYRWCPLFNGWRSNACASHCAWGRLRHVRCRRAWKAMMRSVAGSLAPGDMTCSLPPERLDLRYASRHAPFCLPSYFPCCFRASRASSFPEFGGAQRKMLRRGRQKPFAFSPRFSRGKPGRGAFTAGYAFHRFSSSVASSGGSSSAPPCGDDNR